MIESLAQRAMRPAAEQIAGGTFPQDLGDFNGTLNAAYKKVVG